jgi:Fe2+ or Zn2+ uptake regulation protein
MSDILLIKVRKATIETGDAELLLSEVNSYLSNQPNEEQYQSIKNKFTEYLVSKGLSRTPERFKTLEKICVEKGLFTHDTIHIRVLKEMCVSIRTIRYTFKLLIEANIIKRVDENQKLFKTAFFELCH